MAQTQSFKIGRPIPGPVAPPVPEPVPHTPYRKDTGIVENKPKVWVMTEVDIEPVCEWLVPLLKKRWSRLSEDGIRFWLRSAISDRFTHLVRTENVVGMAYSSTDVLEPQPRVFEKFVRSKKEASDEERLELYRNLRQWARSIKAREFVFGLDTNVAMDLIKPGLQNDREHSNVSPKTHHVCSLMET